MIGSVIVTATGVMPAAPQATPATPSAARVDAFQDALSRRSGEQDATANAGAAADPDANARARQGLGLEGTQAAQEGNAGDMILNGLERLRGVFDVRESHIAELMTRSNIDAGTMMAMQMEVANFTMLVDITSKLTGKSTQAFDTLMKGQ